MLLRQSQHQLSANNYVQTYCNIRGTLSKFGLDNVQRLTVISSTVIISFFQQTFSQFAAIWHGTHLSTSLSLKGLSLAKFSHNELASLVTFLVNAYLCFCLSFLYIITANFHSGPEHCLWELSHRNAQQMTNFLSNCKWSTRKDIWSVDDKELLKCRMQSVYWPRNNSTPLNPDGDQHLQCAKKVSFTVLQNPHMPIR